MKIIWFIEPGTFESQEYLIQNLISHGHIVDIKRGWAVYTNFAQDVDSFNKEYYDYAIYNLHVGHPNFINKLHLLSVKQHIIMDHDLLMIDPEGIHPPIPNKTLIVFTKKHIKICKKNNLQYRTAHWYKLDMPIKLVNPQPNPLDNCILVDSDLFKKDFIFPYKYLFKKTFLKKWRKEQDIALGADKAPDALAGMQGLLNGPQFAKFWFIRESSLYVEALMVNCIPILFNFPRTDFDPLSHQHLSETYITSEIPFTPIVSEINVGLRVNESTVCNFNFRAITPTNLEEKIKFLQKSPELIDETLKILKEEWLITSPLRSTTDILLDLIK